MTQHEVKTFSADIKAIGGTKAQPSGVFEALVAVFGNVDYGADRTMPGAFAASLAEWEAKGDPIPVIWSHEWDDPTSHIGVVTEAKETPEGLLVRAELDVKNNPKAAYIARLLADRRVTQFSFGYVAKEWDFVQDPDYGQVRELKVIDLFEVGPTLRGMNPATQLLEAASALRSHNRSGLVVSGKNEQRIRAAYEALGEMLTSLADGKAAAGAGPERKDVDVPAYMSRAAAQGLAYVDEGFGGDGLQEQTIADARDMAEGFISVEKVALIGPWIARHRQDWEQVAENNDPQADGFPGPGAVAAYLWGVDPTDSESADRVSAWAESEADEYADDTEDENDVEQAGKSAEPDTIITEVPEVAEATGDTPTTIDPEWFAELLVLSQD